MPRNKNFSVYTPFICSHCSSIFNAFIKNINILRHKINLSENQPKEQILSNHKTPFQLFRAVRGRDTRTFVGIPLYILRKCLFACLFVCFITFLDTLSPMIIYLTVTDFTLFQHFFRYHFQPLP